MGGIKGFRQGRREPDCAPSSIPWKPKPGRGQVWTLALLQPEVSGKYGSPDLTPFILRVGREALSATGFDYLEPPASLTTSRAVILGDVDNQLRLGA